MDLLMPLLPKTPKSPRRGGPRFTNAQRMDVMSCVWIMRRRGYNQYEIAEVLGVSQAQVSMYLSKISEYYKSSQLADAHATRLEKLDQYNELIKEAFEAWQRSQEDYEQVVTDEEPKVRCPACKGTKIVKHKTTRLDVACPKCRATGWLGGIISQQRTQRGQVGDPRFLQILKSIHDSVCDLLGLNLGQKGTNQVNILNWDTLAGVKTTKPAMERLKEIELLPAKPLTPVSFDEPAETKPAEPNQTSPSENQAIPNQPDAAAAASDHSPSENGAPSTNGNGKSKKRYK